MKRFLAACLLFVALPTLAAADYWETRCTNGVCRRVLVRTSAPAVVAATPASYVVIMPEPVVSFASFIPPEPAAPIAPVAASTTTCNCSVTGICTCDPALCQCPSCRTGAINMARSRAYAPGWDNPPTQNFDYYGDGAAIWNDYLARNQPVQYASGNSYFSVAQPTAAVYSTSTGFVTKQTDAAGNVWVGHSGGSYNRRVARHIRKGVRLGVE